MAVMDLIERGVTVRQVVTAESFAECARGGRVPGRLDQHHPHLLAIAQEAEIDLTMEDVAKSPRRRRR